MCNGYPVGYNPAVEILTTNRWDASDYLETTEDMLAYLDEAARTGDPALLQAALGDIAKAKGMSEIARVAGVGRESLYKSLRTTGNPSFQTIAKVIDALGGQLAITPKSPAA
jgi:probable addiction module antidote protein